MPANLIPPASGQYLGSPNLGGPPPPWNDRAGQLGLMTDKMIRVSQTRFLVFYTQSSTFPVVSCSKVTSFYQ